MHVDTTQVYTEKGKLYLLGIDQTTKFGFARLYEPNSCCISERNYGVFSNLITEVLTDNRLQFTRHKVGRQVHIFTQMCKELGIEHRTKQPFHPWTHGGVSK